jgi:lysophospholipase L1-like esterase
LIGLILAAGALVMGQAAPPAPPWESDIQAFEKMDRESPPKPGGVLFVGSSSIRMWDTLAQDFPEVPVIRRGFGGSAMSDVVRFADRIIIPYKPRLIVVYAGDNDINDGTTPERVLDDYRALVGKVRERLPRTRVAFISIKPSLARWKLVEPMRKANELVREFSAPDSLLTYIDVFTPMLGADGTPRKELFLEDGLHLTAEGYAVWRDVVAPYIEEPKR